MSTRPPPKKTKRSALPLQDHITLNKKFQEHGVSQCQLATDFNVSKSHVKDTLKCQAQFMVAFEENASNGRKRLHGSGMQEKIDDMTWQWFQTVRASNLPLSGPPLQEKALTFATSASATSRRPVVG